MAVSSHLLLVGLSFLICGVREKDVKSAEALPAVRSLNLLFSHLQEMAVTEVLVYNIDMFPLQGDGFYTLKCGGLDLKWPFC